MSFVKAPEGWFRAVLPNDSGQVNALSLLVLMPALLVMMFLAVQGAIYFHGRNTVEYAARGGLQSATGAHTDFAYANLEASKRLQGSMVKNTEVEAGANDGYMWVEARGSVPKILPFFPQLTVSARVSGPIEGFRQ